MPEKPSSESNKRAERSERADRFCPKWSESEISVTTPEKKPCEQKDTDEN